MFLSSAGITLRLLLLCHYDFSAYDHSSPATSLPVYCLLITGHQAPHLHNFTYRHLFPSPLLPHSSSNHGPSYSISLFLGHTRTTLCPTFSVCAARSVVNPPLVNFALLAFLAPLSLVDIFHVDLSCIGARIAQPYVSEPFSTSPYHYAPPSSQRLSSERKRKLSLVL